MRKLSIALLLAATAWSPAYADPDENDGVRQAEQSAQQASGEGRRGGEFGVRGIDEGRQARFEASAERREQRQEEQQQQPQPQQIPPAVDVQVSDGGRGGGRGGFGGGFDRGQQQTIPQAQPPQPQAPLFDRGNRNGTFDGQAAVQQNNNRGWRGQDGGGRRGRDGDDHNRGDADHREHDDHGRVFPVPPLAGGHEGRWNGSPWQSRGWDHDRDSNRHRDNDWGRGGDQRRWDGNRDVYNNGWQRGDNGQWARRDHDDYRYGNNRGNSGWDRGWRNDNRYNWQDYRNNYRDQYRTSRYYNPYGYNYGYRRFSIGIYLDSLFYSNRYWIENPYRYRLPTAPYGYRWVRYYNDVLLVDVRSGYVVDVINDFFW